MEFKMKNLIILLILIIASTKAFAGTCTSISRTNFSPNSVLTSTELNAQFNSVYGAANALDAGCLTDGTLELAALGTSEFSVQLNGITQGCKVTKSDAATLAVDKCIATINGNNLKTTASNTVTWGCTGCASESSATTYYLYIKDGSTGTTMDLLISTAAPNNDGYDSSSNKVLAKFYNDASSDIHPVIQQWLGAFFDNNFNKYSARIANNGTASIVSQGGDHDIIASVNRSAAGTVDITYNTNEFSVIPSAAPTSEANTFNSFSATQTASGTSVITTSNTTGSNSDQSFTIVFERQGADKRSR
jgi:hypothetical protein